MLAGFDGRDALPRHARSADRTPAGNPSDFHIQAEVFKREWDKFRDLPQPWQIELAPDRLMLLPEK